MTKSPFKHLKYLCTAFIAMFLIVGCSTSKNAKKSADKSGVKNKRSKSEDGMKSYSEVITDDAKTDQGLFDSHKDGSTYYYEIPDSLLNREMLLVSRIAETQANIGYGGEKLNTQVVRWQRKDDNILLRHVSYENTANDSLPVYKAVRNSNFEPIIASFEVKSMGKDSSGVVIDATKLYNTDIPALGLQSSRRKQYGARRLDKNRTFIDSVNSYPKNIEVRSLLTYKATKPPSSSSTGTISLKVNHSMVLMPDEKMDSRSYDRRIGYFNVQQTDYGTDADKAKQVQHITRYKLVPKDKEAYLDGELVEPVNPIVYYVDPATPQKWRSYLKEGVEDWQEAFEEAGFKNAIIAKDPPSKEENPDWSPEDARYSVIRYFASDIQNAYGPNTHDPRTGQIIESDIGWYHNVMNLLRNWYFVQTAAANPDARGVEFKDDVMGNLIRFVSSHEVGHTLGLAHNYGSSYAYPVDSLRSPSFTSTHGTAPSIMDYARFNYVAQPGDGVEQFHPAIGTYDKWAIKWGYTWFPESMNKEQKEAKLNTWTRNHAGDPEYFYGKQTSSKIDPRSQNEDLGNNAMRASELGIANLKRITAHLVEWTKRDGSNYDQLEELYGSVVGQWGRYMGHVTKNIGGVYENDKTYDQDGPVYRFVPKKKQQRAMNFLTDYAFSTPSWMLNEDVLDRINQSSVVDNMRSAQVRVLKDVVDAQRIARLIEFDTRSDKDTYDAFEMMDDLRHGIWGELDSNGDIGVHRRNLQRAYIERMEYLMTNELPNIPAAFKDYIGWTDVNVSQSDMRPIVRNQLELLLDDIQDTKGRINDRATYVHLSDAEVRIKDVLNPDD